MQRLIARFLLLVALVGNLGPLAVAAAIAPPHACCVRKAVHHCHSVAVSESDQLIIRDAGCCNHDCCRAVTTARWAHAQPPVNVFYAQNVSRLDQPNPVSLNIELLEFHSSRAPPSCRS